MSLYYKFKNGECLVILSYVDNCCWWSSLESIGKWFVEELGKYYHVNFLGYIHWFMLIQITQKPDYSIVIDQSRYCLAMVNKYLNNTTVSNSAKVHARPLPADMTFTKDHASENDVQVEELMRTYNLHYRCTTGALI